MGNLHAVVSLLHAPDGGGPLCASFEVASGRCVGLWVIGFLRFTGCTGCCCCCGALWSWPLSSACRIWARDCFFWLWSPGCRDEGWIRPGLPSLSMLAGPLQHFWDVWLLKAASKLCWALLDVTGTRQLLFSSHLRDWDKMLLRSICGGWSHLHLTSFASLTRPRVDLGYWFSLH